MTETHSFMQSKEIQNPLHFQMVKDEVELQQVCQRAQQQSAVALDTEFVRVRSYYPKLGLIQLYDGEQVSLIDPIAIEDFSPFIALLNNRQVVKILHSCGEDLDVFLHYFQQLPTPMADTQIMAQFLGYPLSTGFATLIADYFQLELDKTPSRTNWLARPLSTQQLHYAAADVWYLLPLYQQMCQQISQTPWQSAVQNECELLLEKKQQIKSTEQAYFAISNAWRLDREGLMRLKLLAKWRQEEAMKRDLALNFVVRAEHLWLAAKENPKHTSQLLELGFSEHEVRIHGKKILQLLGQVKRIDAAEYPPRIERLADHPDYKSTLKQLQQALQQMTPEGLNTELIASKRSLEQLMKYTWLGQENAPLPDLLLGWRQPFGKQLQSLLREIHA